jgi:galactokinase
MPAAISMATRVAMSPRNDGRISAQAGNFSEMVDFEIGAAGPNPSGHWSDYIYGVALVLEAAGYALQGSSTATSPSELV